MKKIISLLAFAILLSCAKLDPKVEIAAKAIREKTCITPDWLIDSEEYENLLSVATNEDLVFLTDDDDPNVRYYSFIGLIERNYPKINEIHNSHKGDEQKIFTSNGACLRNWVSLNSLLDEAIAPESFYNLAFAENAYRK